MKPGPRRVASRKPALTHALADCDCRLAELTVAQQSHEQQVAAWTAEHGQLQAQWAEQMEQLTQQSGEIAAGRQSLAEERTAWQVEREQQSLSILAATAEEPAASHPRIDNAAIEAEREALEAERRAFSDEVEQQLADIESHLTSLDSQRQALTEERARWEQERETVQAEAAPNQLGMSPAEFDQVLTAFENERIAWATEREEQERQLSDRLRQIADQEETRRASGNLGTPIARASKLRANVA